MEVKITIIIVNWNSGILLSNALESIINHNKNLVSSVIIVDNDSNDQSIFHIEKLEGLPFQLKIIRNSKNLGFAAACNQGANIAKTKYLLFLNPDTQIFSNSLISPLEFMEDIKNSSIGICGIRLINDDGDYAISAARFPTLKIMLGKIFGLSKIIPTVFPPHLMSSSELGQDTFVDQVIGAFFLVRRKVFDACHGFDENFFVYFEEVDFSLRAKSLGYSSYYLSTAKAYHKEGGCSGEVKANRLFYSIQSRFYYAKKHYSTIQKITLYILTLFELPIRIIKSIIQLSKPSLFNTIQAYSMLAKSAFIKGRKR